LKALFAILPVFVANKRRIFIKIEASPHPQEWRATASADEILRLARRPGLNRLFTMDG